MSKLDVHPNKDGNEVIFTAHKEILDKEENEIEVKSLTGNDRYETAIKVSQERFDNGEADAVILFGKDAVVDGLAATKYSPILLTTEGLNQLQEESIKGLNNIHSLTRVGNGISENTINTVVDLFNK